MLTRAQWKANQAALDYTKDKTMVRSISAIAREIEALWVKKDGSPNVNYAARPYLDAMHSLTNITDNYGCDDARSIVLYFLSNASSFRGEDAKRIKAELKAL